MFLLELIFVSGIAALLGICLSIPFARAGPFSLIILGALGFSFICLIQGYINLIGKLELPLGSYVVSLFVRKYSPRAIQKVPARSKRNLYHRR
jgi:hypothetical protein